ncbi:hypothetical protein Tco_0531265 [Tanacetum coccineum]
MDESNLTMEEYIKLEAEKARKRDFPAIIYNDALTTDHEVSSEPTVRPLDNNEMDFRISLDESDDEDYICIYDKSSFSYKLIYVNDLKMDSEKDIDEVNLPRNDVVIERLDNDIDYNDGVYTKKIEEVHGLRESMGEQRDVLDAMSRDFSLFTVWAVSSLSQLIDLSGVTYTRYFDSYVPYQRRRVRLRTNDASTSAPQQPDP